MATMQDVILGLVSFWVEQGCLVVQPMNTEVGAGTLNPATFLRVLGPEPWRVVYVEPSVRPDDSRYGSNPNRLQTHTQLQVILKPEPGDPQELYSNSLKSLGIDIAAHDVRFVEDNWASPALGAWGLGWEVWLDGLEITQFTYFQQAGGMTLDPVSVEITYGLERIVMALQRVRHFKDIEYATDLSYGEVFGQAEYEMSRYYLDDASISLNRNLFELYEAEAVRLLESRLPVPAYSYVLKCSHTFNVLDARGAVSTTDRATSFARMRRLAHDVAGLWMERREENGYPLGVSPPSPTPSLKAMVDGVAPAEPSTLVFEIGTEELSANDVSAAPLAVAKATVEHLRSTHLEFGRVEAFATPRRISLLVHAVAAGEPDRTEVVRGPRIAQAYDDSNAPTPSALGFARAQNVDVASLQRITEGDKEYVGVQRLVEGRDALSVLGDVLASVVRGLRAGRNMRWGAPDLSYGRPIRWLVALLGEAVVPVAVSSLTSSRSTRIRVAGETVVVEVASAESYIDVLSSHDVAVDPARRREQIGRGVRRLASSIGAEIVDDQALLVEVGNLVETPNPILGEFDEAYLSLPEEVLITVMRKHQRYFPLRKPEGPLLPRFVAVADGPCDPQVVTAGNEAVLRARYDDALFFWNTDLRSSPTGLRSRLETLVFDERLGSMGDHAIRLGKLAMTIADRVGLFPEERATLERCVPIVKFDLASQMVTELPTLAGVMAREYAIRAGVSEAAARALFEVEVPRSSSDSLPETFPGILLSIAARLDVLAGFISVGADPTGSSDPFGLRRAALAVLAILRHAPRLRSVSIVEAIRLAGALQPVAWSAAAEARTVEFIRRRHEQALIEEGFPSAIVRAVLSNAQHPIAADAALAYVMEHRDDDDFRGLQRVFLRVASITPPGTPVTYDAEKFSVDAERVLAKCLEQAQQSLADNATIDDFVSCGRALIDPIDRFFDEVLVMDSDEAVRRNRLALLSSVRKFGAGWLEWSELG